MARPSKLSIVFNGGAAIVILGSAALIARSYIVGDSVPACEARYGAGVQWSFEREGGGELMSPYDLQARLAGTDWGLIQRADIVSVANSPAGGALQVDLGKEVADNGEPIEKRLGVGFQWKPSDLQQASAACLSYSMFIPEGFEFGPGGRLPGLMGGAAEEPADDKSAFSTRFAWTEKGDLNVHGDVPGAPSGRGITNERRSPELPRGRWVKLEQEVVLNVPGQKNGIMRVWMDGSLVLERRNVAYRKDAAAKITAVLADVSYRRPPAKQSSNAKVWLTPFELRWKTAQKAAAE